MTSSVALKTDPAPITACTVARDVQNFDLLIEDMETELGEAWGDLSFDDANAYLSQPDATDLEFIAVAVDTSDENNLTLIGDIITRAKDLNIKVILIAEDVTPIALHQLLKLGANDFVPYPLPEGALHDSIVRVNQQEEAVQAEAAAAAETEKTSTGKVGTNAGVVLPVHGLAGGAGSSTFAVNLAWELATVDKKADVTVCLLDLDFQFGSASTYLDLPRRDSVLEMLSDIESMDDDSFHATLTTFNDKLQVLTAPADMIPLDMLGPEEIEKLITVARRNFDYVIVDMPTTLVQWTETVLGMSDVYFGLLELDLRSAQNALRMIRALKSESLPYEKIRYVLNRAPKFTDMSGKSRAKRMAESLEISMELHMPDGGKQVAQSCDHGLPLVDTAAKNPLRKEIAKLANSLHEANQAEATG
ncbi:MAG: AAA family ATPase [Litoreibacter sp.]|uniref:AAA family ATPase n=1 Tax=Litoreibacter sp. TaxID=1969459 RepID=UPI00329A4E9E